MKKDHQLWAKKKNYKKFIFSKCKIKFEFCFVLFCYVCFCLWNHVIYTFDEGERAGGGGGRERRGGGVKERDAFFV